MRDFWLSCGHHLLDRAAGGGLAVTDEFLKAYLARPELTPSREACDAEHALHAALLANPRQPVSAQEISGIADADARENWGMMIAFRDHLLAHSSLEAAYVGLVRDGAGRTPPLFMDQLVHVILRNILDDCSDPFVLRAAELFFRRQRVMLHEGSLLVADEERVGTPSPMPASPLVALLGLDPAAQIDVIDDANSESYWDRSDRFDMALDLTAGRRGPAALAQVVAAWVQHLLAVEVEVEPLVQIRNAKLTWYVGLDAEGTKIGDMLWNGGALDADARARIVGLFRLRFRDPDTLSEVTEGEPIYLVLAMTPNHILGMKPQNLIAGLPVRRLETVT